MFLHYRNYITRKTNVQPPSFSFLRLFPFFRPFSSNLQTPTSDSRLSARLDVARHLASIALPDEPLSFDRSSPVDPSEQSKRIKRSRLAILRRMSLPAADAAPSPALNRTNLKPHPHLASLPQIDNHTTPYACSLARTALQQRHRTPRDPLP